MYRFLLPVLLLTAAALPAQDDWAARPWPAAWITAPCAPPTDFAVVEFHRAFTLETVPDSLPVMVSADNRYQLFVNGQLVGMGPSRADRLHWRYATYDLRPFLVVGENHVTATVWNFGFHRPRAQESLQLAFVLQPRTDILAELRTDGDWEVRCLDAYAPITDARARLRAYYVAGPQLRIDARRLPRAGNGYPGQAAYVTRALPRGTDTEMLWPLVPRQIPELERRPLPALTVIRDGRRAGPFRDTLLPAHTRDSFLLDVGHMTNAFFTLRTAGGTDATVQLAYAESLRDADGRKGHRDSVAGKHLLGVYDEFITDGAPRAFSTLWFRSGRYLQLTFETADEPLRLTGLDAVEVAYPFAEGGGFRSTDTASRIDEIVDVGWRTARLCAQETYVDCPYYEQLQYPGDTRIQALISLYASGDARLMRKAIQLFGDSRIAEGLTLSRAPDNAGQIIPPYSLMWVLMVHDYARHVDEPAFVAAHLDGVAAVLDWYRGQELDNGLIGPTPYWNFVDWTPRGSRWNDGTRKGGEPPQSGGSSVISGQYLQALDAAAALFGTHGGAEAAAAYRGRADRLRTAITATCWDAGRGLLADTPGGDSFSQHANVLGIINGGLPRPAGEVLDRVLGDTSLVPASSYFDFYLGEALYAADRGDRYPAFLQQWRDYLDQGFTTWPEQPGETRSDCHAWSSSPNYHLPALLAGVRPASMGFRTVRIRPAAVPDLPYHATVPTPLGAVEVDHRGRGHFVITLPAGMEGTFSLGSTEQRLRAGTQEVTAGK